jgi:primosomal protein N' (replication factor Y)
LHGITGSGKTEVYLGLIRQVLAQGKQALVLVPEINLTPQLEAVFRGRFSGVPVASLHSGMAEGERVNHYLAAQSGAARIVLGTRLAVFTPVLELGLIIVDEEHDSSFKQQDGLRYSARDVAIFRAQKLGIPIVLGSATPSLESYHRAHTGHYHYLQLTSRAVDAAELPAVHCVTEAKGETGIAQRVLDALRERVTRREQSLVFINRRGYAPVLLCPQCRWVAGCRRCTANLVLHGPKPRLHCHHCGLQEKVPERCPNCGNGDLRSIGRGTQRMETELAEHFPEARILRIDRDSTRRKGVLHGFLDRIAAQQVDILVGTQMLAKGHDFPQLTLVVVLNADASLYSPDFRAEERLFAQLLQVSGRAGRAETPGEVLVQTAFPDHPLYRALRSHDYAGFAESQLKLRRAHNFPPYAYLAVLRAESAKPGSAAKFVSNAAETARHLAEGVMLFDPVPAPIAKLAGRERWQLAMQSPSRPALQRFLTGLLDALEGVIQRDVRWAIDVDPLEL